MFIFRNTVTKSGKWNQKFWFAILPFPVPVTKQIPSIIDIQSQFIVCTCD